MGINFSPPITSLLTSFSNISEKLIYSRLLTHICMNDILVDEQCGFTANISTKIASH